MKCQEFPVQVLQVKLLSLKPLLKSLFGMYNGNYNNHVFLKGFPMEVLMGTLSSELPRSLLATLCLLRSESHVFLHFKHFLFVPPLFFSLTHGPPGSSGDTMSASNTIEATSGSGCLQSGILYYPWKTKSAGPNDSNECLIRSVTWIISSSTIYHVPRKGPPLVFICLLFTLIVSLFEIVAA
jgi:hypothetical protein